MLLFLPDIQIGPLKIVLETTNRQFSQINQSPINPLQISMKLSQIILPGNINKNKFF